jgi:hypothetical protein
MKKIFTLFCIALLTGCADPLADSDHVFVGLWKSNQTSLLITQSGRLEYETQKGSAKTSISLPIKSISESEIVAGFLFINANFEIKGKPKKTNGLIVLEVDGEKLFKANEQGKIPQVLTVPDMKEIRFLVTSDLNRLADGMSKKIFTAYIDHASLQFQSQYTNEELLKTYKPFLEKKIDLKHWMEGKFILTKEPEIDEDGVLNITGRYPTSPNSLKFSLNFVFSQPEWKSLGPDLKINKNS